MPNNAVLALLLSIAVHSLAFSAESDQISRAALGDHLTKKELVDLNSEAGLSFFAEIDSTKFAKLKKFWGLQRPSYCGVCSSVIATNTLAGSKTLNQDTFFSDDVLKIIGPETVGEIGLTLREIRLALAVHNPNATVTKYHSNLSGMDLLIDQLEAYEQNDSIAIVNLSTSSLQGTGMKRGHFSIIAGYSKESRRVLILEVNNDRHYWVKVDDLYTAMLAVDRISRIPRGCTPRWAAASQVAIT